MICEIINPSDPYTLVTDDFVLGVVAVMVLGDGAYGLVCGELHSPVMFGWPEWLTAHGLEDADAYLAANYERLAAVLDTVLIGNERARAECERLLAHVPPEQHAAYLADRHDARRSSMNDIGARAKRIAARLRELAAEKTDRVAPEGLKHE